MANLKDIKLRIAGVQKTQQITRAMKMVATSKMKRASNAIISLRPYAEKLNQFIENLDLNDEVVSNLVQSEREIKTHLIIVIAGDKGLCGGFNANVRKELQATITSDSAKGITTKLIVVGKKAQEFSKKLQVEIIASHIEIFKDIQFSHAVEILTLAKSVYESEQVDRVSVIYNQFVNVITQVVQNEQLLPLLVKRSEEPTTMSDYIFEPSKAALLANIIPKYLTNKVWKALLESNASEQAARMMAMDNSTNNAGDMIIQLRKVYNKIRQASITTEISEIVGGAAALQD
jgi:F-type H+-transporting ATPase subunit gamma